MDTLAATQYTAFAPKTYLADQAGSPPGQPRQQGAIQIVQKGKGARKTHQMRFALLVGASVAGTVTVGSQEINQLALVVATMVGLAQLCVTNGCSSSHCTVAGQSTFQKKWRQRSIGLL